MPCRTVDGREKNLKKINKLPITNPRTKYNGGGERLFFYKKIKNNSNYYNIKTTIVLLYKRFARFSV